MHALRQPARRPTPPATARETGAAVRVRTIGLALALAGSFVLSGPAVAQEEEWHYVVIPGDNPWNLTERYLDGMRYWPLLQELNRIEHPTRIPPGTHLRIPSAWLRPRAATAEVVSVSGTPRLVRGGTELKLTMGMRVESGDRIETPSDGAATVEFGDHSRVVVRGDSVLRIEQLQRFENTDIYRTRVLLERGRTDHVVTPSGGKPSRFESLTPSAVTAVRGTEYRVSARDDEARAEVLEGRVSLSTAAAAVDVPAGFGAVARGTGPPLPPVALLPPPDVGGVPRLFERVPIAFPAPQLSGAARLRLQIALGKAFELPVFDALSDTTTVRGPDIPDGEYSARLRGVDAEGLEGQDAAFAFVLNARPEPPILVEPPPEGAVRESNPRLRWAERERVAGYRVQLATDDRFAPPMIDAGDVAAGFFVVPEPLQPGRYFWRVAAIDAQEGAGPFSDPQTFRRPPPGPALDALAFTDRELVLRWRAGLPGQRYQVQLAETDAFDAPLVDTVTDAAQLVLPRPLGGTYFVRIRTIDTDGFEGFFDPPQKISVPNPLPPWWLIFLLLPVLIF